MDFQQAALAICGVTVAYVLYGRYRNLTIRDVPGPKNPSWIYGISGARTMNDTISPVLEQDTNGTGKAERGLTLRRAFSKNTEP